VRNYVSAILAKLDLSSRAEAAAYAVRHHIQDHMPEPRETRDERR
jgi:DNA-binding NarL/FixJ family response regulator